MIPYKTLLRIDRSSKQALHIQLTNQFIDLIKARTLIANAKLPSSRTLSKLIGVHRQTVVASYEELALQGWVKSIVKKGTYVNEDVPVLQQQWVNDRPNARARQSGFQFRKALFLNRVFPQHFDKDYIYINDGVSDERLAPVNEIATLYRKLSNKKYVRDYMGYGTTYGNATLREVLVDYLNITRGLNITIDNILITRGSQMGMFLASQLLIETSGYIVIGETNYSSADTTFQYANAKLLRVRVDKDGLDTKEIETLAKTYNVRAVYTTPHHHHPTTVTLSAQRRIHLLNLSKTYGFAIIEDDYDYDFNYNHAPILPLASHDINGNVIYVGSVCKTVAPVYRVGYLVASKDFVDECAKLRRFVDRQGDAILELTFASFIKEGNLDRHINKVTKIYKTRRDFFCKLLKAELDDYLSFQIPKGGMAIWAILNKSYSWNKVTEIALKHKLIIPEWQRYDMANLNHNAIRIGFASYNEDEAVELVSRLKNIMLELS
ncbi:aminotransferase-like domain-containing protein [Hyunsoonleella pacifica]|uniref:PLP-dependent aminotransferase family protein n=1 Tax=Hyunsoonleella pacifica TaxID=1080224 RepID=A0A4Q9FNK0_9FLAO|nr:PLP-dependent aminotransferase family protein [Hyunsoonleella pacifica]TBN15821.1 PLP-dependent aminotransferase family protein [Hyunsoonleella pacifica]GGD22919.1 GntR family transcriptional regulator [Hyunsoonleella pacifica]